MPTKPGHEAPRNALADTVRVEPGVAVPAPPPPTLPPEAPPGSEPPPGERYQLGAELGRGGMGRVVEAFDVQLGRMVALKEILPSGGASIARRFAREVQLTARLEHPSIVPVYDAGTTVDGRPFYVMRRVSGRPLDQVLASTSGLRDRLTLVPAVLAAIDAVAHAHRRGVIHRDLKPANILVGELGETVVIDWGLAKGLTEDDDPALASLAPRDDVRTQYGAVFGTPGFMAPEQARGEPLGPRGDVYALGATLYQLLAGAPPHTGPSATQVIAQTGVRAVTPVDELAPGAPPELIAIVHKALAFDPAERYADAGALGEDLRRFLAGQLVAAHRYTRRQRLARFARRHRGALGVGALALIAVTALAVISVRRVVDERDAATTARELATRERDAAARARDEVQARADQLVVAQARSLLETNPTHALAVLKELPAGTRRLGEARAVAQAAALRIPAWTMQAPDVLTVYAELSPDGRFVVQTMRDGMVRVTDLEHHEPVIARAYPTQARAIWAGRQILVTGAGLAPELLDPIAGKVRALGVGAIRWAAATDAGDAFVLLDPAGAAQRYDVATATAHPLWPGHAVRELAIAPDGAWIALADDAGVMIVDRAGHERAHRPAKVSRLVASSDGQLAYLGDRELVVAQVGAGPVSWRVLDTQPFAPGIAIDLQFRGHELDVFWAPTKILAWDGTRMWERVRIEGMQGGLAVGDRGLLIVPGLDGKLRISNDAVAAEIHLPAPIGPLRVVARPGAPRVLAIGRGALVVFELAGLPERLALPPGLTAAVFVDDNTLLLGRSAGDGWQWYDLARRAATPVAFEPRGLTSILDVDTADGRVLVRDQADSTALVVLRRGAPAHEIARGGAAWGRLLADGAVVLGLGDGRVLASLAGGAPVELVKLDGLAADAVGLGGRRFAAVSTAGELVRGDLATGEVERAHLPPGEPSALAADRAGRVLVAQGGKLLRWDRTLTELAHVDQRIVGLWSTEAGVLLELTDHAVVRAPLTAGAPLESVLGAAPTSPLITGDHRLVVGPSVNGQVVVVETATRARWELPAFHAAYQLTAISPSTRRLVELNLGTVVVWSLPLAPPELRDWLDARTNALTDADHALVWPWQPGAPTR